jgi:GxxExxY protein
LDALPGESTETRAQSGERIASLLTLAPVNCRSRSIKNMFLVYSGFGFSYFRVFVVYLRFPPSRDCNSGTVMSHEFEPVSGKIIEAAIAVHVALGPGFLESIYHSALRIALRNRGIPYESQKKVHIYFEGAEVGVHCLDLLVDSQVVVELKAVEELADIHFAQVRSYLKATSLRVGLLLNFGEKTLNVKRIVKGT